MLLLFTALATVSLLLVFGGALWMFAAQESEEQEEIDNPDPAPLSWSLREDDSDSFIRKTSSRAGGKVLEERAAVDFKEIKKMVDTGSWMQALPALLAVSGLMGLIIFGSLALFAAVEDKLLGGIVCALAIFTVLRVVVRMARA